MFRIAPHYWLQELLLIGVLPFPTLDHSRSLRKVQATPLQLHSLQEDQRQDVLHVIQQGKRHVFTLDTSSICFGILYFCA